MTTTLPVISATIATHDNTMMAAWKKCPRWYYIRHVLNLSPKGTSPALQFGSIIHLGLAEWYRGFDLDKALSVIEAADFEEVIGDYRTKGRAITVLKEYVEYYGKESRWEILATETGTSVADKEGFRFGGRLDLIVRNIRRKKVFLVDTKTTSRGGESWWLEWNLSPQMSGYAWMTQQLQGQPIDGVLVNRIITRQNEYPPEECFQRRVFQYPAWKLKEWRDQQIGNYDEIEKAAAAETGGYPPNWYSCAGKYSYCPAYGDGVTPGVCRAPASSREGFLKEDFEHNPWDWRSEE